MTKANQAKYLLRFDISLSFGAWLFWNWVGLPSILLLEFGVVLGGVRVFLFVLQNSELTDEITPN